MIETIIALLTSGAGGGIVGGIFGFFKQREERKERLEVRKLDLERDRIDAEERKADRQHELIMLEKGADLSLRETEVTTEAEIAVANQSALKGAQQFEFQSLKTTSAMDNWRASVRPFLAYWAAGLFTTMLGWAFHKWHELITADQGIQILMGLFTTLTFAVTSVITFYYMARRNPAPKS